MSTVTEMLPRWKTVFRGGIAPNLTLASLEALYMALADDDPALIQGATTSPPPLACAYDWPVDAACAVAFALWKGEGLVTVNEVEQRFFDVCLAAEQLLGEEAAARHLLSWWDETPRAKARRELLAEVEGELYVREGAAV